MNKLIINILCLGVVFSCTTKTSTEETTKKPEETAIVFTKSQFQNMAVELGAVEEKLMDISIDANGVVDVPPDQMFAVTYPLTGIIMSINHNLLPGKFIKKGEKLAQIQSVELLQIQEDYLNETIKNELFVQENDRQKSLMADDATAKRKYQESENALKLNRVRIKGLAEKLKVLGINPEALSSANISAKHTLIAAQDAYVKNVNVTNGKSFRSDETLFELISTKHMHVELKVFGDDMQFVKEGQDVDFKTPEGKNVIGKVYLIDKTVDMENKSLNLHVHVEDESFEKSLRPGQFISGSINIKNSNVVALPESAILSNSDGKYVFRIMEDKNQVKFEKIEVKTGRMAHGFIEIVEPQKLSGQIAVKGVSFIDNAANKE